MHAKCMHTLSKREGSLFENIRLLENPMLSGSQHIRARTQINRLKICIPMQKAPGHMHSGTAACRRALLHERRGEEVEGGVEVGQRAAAAARTLPSRRAASSPRLIRQRTWAELLVAPQGMQVRPIATGMLEGHAAALTDHGFSAGAGVIFAEACVPGGGKEAAVPPVNTAWLS